MARLINTPQQRDFRRGLRTNGTPSEGRLWKMLRAKQVAGLQFRRQFGVERYILDFYCPELRLGIELDGGVHDSGTQREYDVVRDEFLWTKYGIRVLRFANMDVLRHPQKIVESILRHKQIYEGTSVVPIDD